MQTFSDFLQWTAHAGPLTAVAVGLLGGIGMGVLCVGIASILNRRIGR